MLLDVQIQVVTHNPQLKTSRVFKTKASYFAHQIVGMLALPDAKAEGPWSQLILTGGAAFDVFEKPEALRKKLADLIAGLEA